MSQWLNAIGTALPVVMALALMVWMAITYHGDSRWLRRNEAVDTKSGEMKWPTKELFETTRSLVLGQNDSIADHEDRLGRMEERTEIILGEIRSHLQKMSSTLDDVSGRVIRLEERSKG
jgi:hypothetical protein